MGSLMYLIEGEAHGFTSIPVSVYWAIVTMTTVGYGDIAPQSALGQMLAAALMITGYAIIAVPTGIVSIELAQASREAPTPELPVLFGRGARQRRQMLQVLRGALVVCREWEVERLWTAPPEWGPPYPTLRRA